MGSAYTVTVGLPNAGALRLEVRDADGVLTASRDVPVSGHVDNLLLTAVDNLLKEHTIDRSALVSVVAGPGIDKSSSLYRIVASFASAVAAAHAVGR